MSAQEHCLSCSSRKAVGGEVLQSCAASAGQFSAQLLSQHRTPPSTPLGAVGRLPLVVGITSKPAALITSTSGSATRSPPGCAACCSAVHRTESELRSFPISPSTSCRSTPKTLSRCESSEDLAGAEKSRESYHLDDELLKKKTLQVQCGCRAVCGHLSPVARLAAL